jgi:hypothetical protein
MMMPPSFPRTPSGRPNARISKLFTIAWPLAVSPRIPAHPSAADDGDAWTLRGLERLPLGIPYTEVVRRIVRLRESARPR